MAEPFIAQVWESSAAARREMPDQPPIVRRAVALGRGVLEPLAPLASLAGPSGDALALKLHPLQRHLPRDVLLGVVEQTLVTAINQVWPCCPGLPCKKTHSPPPPPPTFLFCWESGFALASLAGPSGNALALKLQPLQRHLPRDALLGVVEQSPGGGGGGCSAGQRSKARPG